MLRRLTIVLVVLASLLGGLPGGAESTMASTPPAPAFSDAILFGGTGNETGSAIAVGGGSLYVSGWGPGYNQDGIVAQYSLPPGPSPTWSALWPNQAGPPMPGQIRYSPGNSDWFQGVAVSSDGVYAVGMGDSFVYDSTTWIESKGYLVKFPLSGATGSDVGGAIWFRSPNFFSYSGGEPFYAVVTVGDNVYAAGSGQEDGGGGWRTILAKYDKDGALLWKRAYGSGYSGGSGASGMVWLNGYLYLAGYDQNNQAMLLKYDAAAVPPDANPNAVGAAYLTPVWSRLYNPIGAMAQAVATDGTNLYVAGFRNSGSFGGTDPFILKYDQAGTLLWSQAWGGAADDTAYGVAVSGGRVYVAGATTSFGSGGKDVFLLEADAASGTILSTSYWGGTGDDIARALAVSGSDIYVVGETASFGAGGTDLMVLRWALAQEGTWTSKTPMPAARFSAAAAVINGVLYVAGGNYGGATSTLQAYNPTTNTWSTLASMPAGRYSGDGAGVIDGKLYVAGGWDWPASGLPRNTLFVYDPTNNSWSTKAPMPQQVLYGSGNGATGVINGKLYVTTPYNGYSGTYKYLHVYDPAADTWSQLASSPNAHSDPAFGVIDNKFYLAAGGDDSGTHAKLDVYDPATNTWTTKTSMPVARAGPAGAVIGGKLYVIGGSNAGVFYNTVYIYDPSTDTWATETSMPTARASAVAGVINGVIYVAGGSNSTGTLATVEAFFTLPNQAPVANAQSVTTNEDTPKAITLTGSDLDGGALTFSVVTPPGQGSLSGTPPNLTYTPNANFNGSDSFTFKANDGTVDSSPATVSITVTPVNDAPVASSLAISPVSPTSADNLVASYSYFDAEGDAESGSEIRWYKNGLLQSAYNDQKTVPASATAAGEQWHFTVKPKDGIAFGSLQTSATVSIMGQFTLSVVVSPPGSGTVSGGGTYLEGSQATLTASANTGYQFASWSGGATGSTNPITIIMDNNKAVTASFSVISISKKVISLPPDLKVWKHNQPEIDLSVTGQTGDTLAIIGPVVGSRKVAVVSLYLKFGQVAGDIDFANQLKAEADVVNGKAVFYRTSYPNGVGLIHALYVKKLPEHDRVWVVPGAKTLADVRPRAPGSYVLTLADPDLTIITTPEGEKFWKITGISGTGAMGETAPPPAPARGARSFPDPSTWALILSGLAAFGLYAAFRRIRAK